MRGDEMSGGDGHRVGVADGNENNERLVDGQGKL